MYAAHAGHLDMLQLLLQYGMPAAEVMCGVTAACTASVHVIGANLLHLWI